MGFGASPLHGASVGRGRRIRVDFYQYVQHVVDRAGVTTQQSLAPHQILVHCALKSAVGIGGVGVIARADQLQIEAVYSPAIPVEQFGDLLLG